ncbi:MarR family transcriptional regulator [Leucobacter sp. UCMA 4100]|uniref:MarR family winged helix-turn-helix transcriptional regulator n=1 Tax=Leucobacter sp. UCMA 4100 TaxID=2810534 RepID=UPI0022EB9832|nr:MarR family transcriptional regulator [Leucobacter sp. UCMA 4100]MDA3146313.1 MarR family transcriptional regulator [Leucobacter sp. UCMA 4100]
MSTSDPLSLERQVCFALTVASRSIVAAYKPVLDPLGITHPQYLVMLALWGNEPQALSDLGVELKQDPSTLSPIIKRLEAQGLVTRQRSAADERKLEITLTKQGRDLRSQAQSVPIAMAERLGMSPEKLQQLHASMIELTEASHRSLTGDEGGTH